MPTIFRVKGYRFFFYSNEGFESYHVHIIGYGGEAKINEIINIVKEKQKMIQEKWNEYFNS